MPYSYYPTTYQPINVPQNHYVPQMSGTPQPQIKNVFVFVDGEASARAYPLEPNSRLMAMDINQNVLYTKTMDASGYPSPLEIYDFYKRSPKEDVIVPQTSESGSMRSFDTENIATKEDISSLREEIRSISRAFPQDMQDRRDNNVEQHSKWSTEQRNREQEQPS